MSTSAGFFPIIMHQDKLANLLSREERRPHCRSGQNGIARSLFSPFGQSVIVTLVIVNLRTENNPAQLYRDESTSVDRVSPAIHGVATVRPSAASWKAGDDPCHS
jgi:hypothetical protein